MHTWKENDEGVECTCCGLCVDSEPFNAELYPVHCGVGVRCNLTTEEIYVLLIDPGHDYKHLVMLGKGREHSTSPVDQCGVCYFCGEQWF